MEMFDEISKEKVDFPKYKSVFKDLSNNKYNFYQIFALCLFAFFFFVGIILGNLFSTCDTVSYYFSETCVVSQFNFSLMLCFWFIGIVVAVFFYSIGEVISLLTSIKEKLTKNKS
mgnify:CR=1 FL=1